MPRNIHFGFFLFFLIFNTVLFPSYESVSVENENLNLSETSTLDGEDFDNFTDISISTAEKLDNEKTVTSTEINTIDLPNIIQSSLSAERTYEDVCMCDLVPSVCEVNCCCDEDCSRADIAVFSKCEERTFLFDDRHCYKSDIFYKNNSGFKAFLRNDLFCIIRDNFKKRFKYREVATFESSSDFEKVNTDRKFSWSHLNTEEPVFLRDAKKAGDALYIVESGTKTENLWRLPSACFSSTCDCYREVPYMEDTKTKCTITIEDWKQECTKNAKLSAKTFGNFCIKNDGSTTEYSIMRGSTNVAYDAMSEYLNISKSTGYMSENCNAFLDTPKPYYNVSTNICHNVVIEVLYTVFHDGINGIDFFTINYTFKNISSMENQLSQNFVVIFQWNANSSNTEVIKRSGNPGYIIGLPVIASIQINMTEGESKSFSLNVLRPGFSILRTDSKSICTITKESIKFGKNVKAGCLYEKKSDSCSKLQEDIYKVLFDNPGQKIFLGKFGNADVHVLTDWVEVFHEGNNVLTDKNKENIGNCELILGIKINVIFAAVGYALNPQYKIVGVVIKYNSPQPIDITCSDVYCSGDVSSDNYLYLSTSVNFYDVSEPLVQISKQIPVISAKLSFDFFYPFLLSAAPKLFYRYSLVFVSFLLSFYLKVVFLV